MTRWRSGRKFTGGTLESYFKIVPQAVNEFYLVWSRGVPIRQIDVKHTNLERPEGGMLEDRQSFKLINN